MGHLSTRLCIHCDKSNPFAPMYNVHHLTGHYMVEAGAYDSPVFTAVELEELRASCGASTTKNTPCFGPC